MSNTEAAESAKAVTHTNVLPDDHLLDREYELLFAVRRSIRYHVRRVQFFERWNRVIKYLTVLSGTATFATVLGELGRDWSMGTALAVAAFATLELVVSTSEKARDHQQFASRFIELERAMVSRGDLLTEKRLAEFVDRRLSIEAEEPPTLRILDVICHNDLVRAMGLPKEETVSLRWYQRWLANFTDVGLHAIQKCS